MKLNHLLLAVFLFGTAGLASGQADQAFIQQFNAGSQLFFRGDYAGAAEILTPLYQQQPQNVKIFDLLKQCYQKLKAYPLLEQLLQKRVEDFPEDYLSWADLGEAELAQNKPEEAEKNFQRALSLAKNQTIIYVRIASAYLAQQKLDEAAGVYLKARRSSKAPYLFARELAQIYEAQNQYEKALAEYFNYYEEDNNRAGEVELIVKSLLEKEEKIPAVEKFLKRRIEEQPKDYLAYRLLGDLYLQREEYAEALKIFQNLDKLLQAEGELLLSFAQECMDKGNLDIAEEAIHSALQRYPRSKNRISARYALAEVYQGEQKYDAALEILREALSDSTAERDKVRALLLAGEISFQNRDFSLAVHFYHQLSQRQTVPQLSGQAFLGMGKAYLAGGKPDSALTCYRQVTKFWLTPPEDEEISFGLGELFFFTGQFDSADFYYRQITNQSLRSPLANDALERMRILAENRKLNPSGLSLLSQSEWLIYQGQFEPALNQLEELKKTEGSLAELAYLEEAGLYQQRKEWQTSLSSLKELMEKYPQSYYSPLAAKLSADLYSQELNQPTLALELYQKILRDYPQALFLDEVREKIKKLSSPP